MRRSQKKNKEEHVSVKTNRISLMAIGIALFVVLSLCQVLDKTARKIFPDLHVGSDT